MRGPEFLSSGSPLSWGRSKLGPHFREDDLLRKSLVHTTRFATRIAHAIIKQIHRNLATARERYTPTPIRHGLVWGAKGRVHCATFNYRSLYICEMSHRDSAILCRFSSFSSPSRSYSSP